MKQNRIVMDHVDGRSISVHQARVDRKAVYLSSYASGGGLRDTFALTPAETWRLIGLLAEAALTAQNAEQKAVKA